MEMRLTGEEEVTSLDLSNEGLDKSDNGDAGLSPLSSQYSSCGESEFDRYCSANSVLGTPSVCSSMGFFHDSMDSDLVSVKGSEGFSLGGSRVSRRFEESYSSTLLDRDCGFGSCSNGEFRGLIDGREGSSSCGGNAGSSPSSGHGVMPMLGSKVERKGVKDFDSDVGKKEDLAVLLKNVENVFLQGAVAARSVAENLLDCNYADEMEDERCREEDETSSRCEHSDDDRSMFNYGSDDESQSHAYYVKNVDDKCDEDAGSGNLVLMNSAVAFGSKDWEDFELDGTNGIHLPANIWEQKQSSGEKETSSPDFALVKSTCQDNFQGRVEAKFEKEVTLGSNDRPVDNKSFNGQQTRSIASLHTSNKIASNGGSDEYLESCSMDNIFEDTYPHVHVAVYAGSALSSGEKENQDIPSDKASCIQDPPALQSSLDLPLDLGVGEASFPQVDIRKDHLFDDLDDDTRNSHFEHVSNPDSSWMERDKSVIHDDLNLSEDRLPSSKGNDLAMNAFYDEIVHDMEEILLDSHDSVGMRLKQKSIIFHPVQSSPKRDGGSSSTTVRCMEADSSLVHPYRIDGIEVVGAKQRKGDVSLSERLVGVREYTVYIIRVWSGESKWDVERRYRDFYTLYHRLKTYFATQEWILPPPWASVERESRKLFGNSSPHVVSERSTLIQECLSSILDSRYFSSLPSAWVLFLSPPEAILSPFQSIEVAHHVGADAKRVSSLGKTISLIVDIQPQKSVKELLDKQHYTCAGCHKDFDNGKTRMQELVLNFGWGKPRFCEYTGQLFCSSCHTYETSVLPARVLHQWDFTPYQVSQLAKSYLDSITDKPMLCVNAVNPFLLSKVPTLLHIVGIRRKIGTMLPHIRCTYRRSIYRRLGYRKYLLETNDFFALRDLIDLSKGAFAALPAILEAVLKKMQEHIIELCLECCDNGIPCGARHACSNPSSLIFPFQEEQEIRRCKSCKSVFHKDCFSKLAECPCGLVFNEITPNRSLSMLTLGNATEFNVKSPVKFISSFFSMSKQEKMKDETDGDNVILMGSLPANSL